MKNKALGVLRAALILALVMALAGTTALASTQVRFATNTKVYETWSTSSRSANVPAGFKVDLVAYKNGWAMVAYKSVKAFIPLKNLELVNPIAAYAARSADVYKKAGSDRMGTVKRGARVYVIGVDGGYYKVQNKEGTVKGYMRKSDVTRKKPVTAADVIPAGLLSTTASKSNPVEYAIFVAQNLVGAPYAQSAKPPETFDCAKFVYYCYGKAIGNVLKGTSYDQGYDDRFLLVCYDDLKRGDLVFFNTVDDGDFCDHVGLYLGGGYFIHASSAGKEVMVSRLDSGYYHRTFSWGRRIVN